MWIPTRKQPITLRAPSAAAMCGGCGKKMKPDYRSFNAQGVQSILDAVERRFVGWVTFHGDFCTKDCAAMWAVRYLKRSRSR